MDPNPTSRRNDLNCDAEAIHDVLGHAEHWVDLLQPCLPQQ